ncbi:hypothetical protein BC567DRAFT_86305 [Phyllosticta citribraziliensis]
MEFAGPREQSSSRPLRSAGWSWKGAEGRRLGKTHEAVTERRERKKKMGKRGIIRQRVKGPAMAPSCATRRAGVAADAVDLLFLDQVPALALPSHPRPAAYIFALYQRQTLRRPPLHGMALNSVTTPGRPRARLTILISAPWRTPTRRTSSPSRSE